MSDRAFLSFQPLVVSVLIDLQHGGFWLQASANLQTRLHRAEAQLEVGYSKQQHLQLQLDSAAAERSALTGELETELDNVAQLVAECKEEHSQRLQVKFLQVSPSHSNKSTAWHCTAPSSVILIGQCLQPT